jgi:ribosomal protein S18 acetylase RimI-like enzyme
MTISWVVRVVFLARLIADAYSVGRFNFKPAPLSSSHQHGTSSFRHPFCRRIETNVCMSSTESQQTSNKIEYRNAKVNDIEAIAELCSDVFDGPFEWHQQIQRVRSVNDYKSQLQDRFTRLVNGGVKHSMIVAALGSSAKIVGFLEVGMLPAPVDVNVDAGVEALDGSSGAGGADDVDSGDSGDSSSGGAVDSTGSGSIWEQATEDADRVRNEQTKASSRQDVPYLGNVAVATDSRRQGIGRRLVRIGMKVAEKWGDKQLCVAVDASNKPAILMYEKLKFSCVLNEEELITRSAKRPPRLFMMVNL